MYVVGPLSGLDQDKDINNFCTLFPFKINMTACAQKSMITVKDSPNMCLKGKWFCLLYTIVCG